jgi:hypothetical protein
VSAIPRLQRTRLIVEGHLCLDCSTRLVRTVRAVPGVRTAFLDTEEGELTVVHDAGDRVRLRVTAAIRAAGFRVPGQPVPPQRRPAPASYPVPRPGSSH